MSRCLNMPPAPASSARQSIWAGDIKFLSSPFLLLKNFPQSLRVKPTANANTEAIEKPMHKKPKSSSASAPHKPAGTAATPLNRSAELCAPGADLEISAATAQQARPISADLETSGAASRQTETPPVRQLSLCDFVHEAWFLLEPVTVLSWSWHLDFICDYLTLIRDGKFRTHHPQLEGIIFNVPPR